MAISKFQQMHASLEHCRVLDLTEGGCMLGARMLGDLGADVIKIEPPEGSPSRIAPYYKNIGEPEKSLYWYAYNINKRGITLDITKAEGQETLKKLAKTVDIIMESFEPGYLDKLDLGYTSLSKIKPDIIITSITPFGQTGPKAKYKGCDLVTWASGGYLYICGDPDRPPIWISFPQASLIAGVEAASATLTALWHRQMTGTGQYVDVSMQECTVPFDFNTPEMWDLNKYQVIRSSKKLTIGTKGVQTTQIWKCKDGYALFICQAGAEPFLGSMKRMIKWMADESICPDWLREMDWAEGYSASTVTQELVDKVEVAISQFIAHKTKQELYEEGALLRRIFTAPLNNVRDIAESCQLNSREFWRHLDHPELKKSLTYCGPFINLSKTPIKYKRRAPLIGEHNSEVLRDLNLLNQASVLPGNSEVKETYRNDKPKLNIKDRRVFDGIKVAEFAWVIAGPQSSRYLADHGAIVVKIESHNNLDMMRGAGPFPGNKPSVDGSMFFGKYNANKYGVSLDLNHPRGRELAWRFIKWGDIVTESFRPGTMQKWGLDYESVRKVRPDIIYLSTSMQGQKGPSSQFAGTGSMLCALAGFGEISGWTDRMPAPPYGAYSDYFCQRFNSTALIAALEHRRRTGEGQWIEQSQLESSLQLFSPLIMDNNINGKIATRHGNRLAYAAPHGVFPCKGADNWVVIAVFNEKQWLSFCKAMGNSELARNIKYASLQKRKEKEDELEKLIGNWTLNHTAEEIETVMQEESVCAHKLEKSSDLFEDIQLKHRNYFVRLEHPVIGRPAYPQQSGSILSKTPREITMASPCLGEHNEYVFKELLGMTDEEIAEHIIDGSITTQLPEGFRFAANS